MTIVQSQADNPRRVLHRALVLGLLSVRFTMEFATKGRGIIEAEDVYIYDQMTHIINSSQELRDALTSNEAKLLKLELGEIPTEIMTGLSWSSELTGTLLWSINAVKAMPALDDPFGLELLNTFFIDLGNICWALPSVKKPVIFRDMKEILLTKTQVETVFQRALYAREIRGKGRKLPLKAYDDIFHFTSMNLPIGSSGDLTVLGKEFCDLSESDEKILLPIITSRIHALRWVINPEHKWDSIDLESLYTLPT